MNMILDDEDYEDYDDDDEEKGPALEIYGTDLTLLARLGQLEECFGRERDQCYGCLVNCLGRKPPT